MSRSTSSASSRLRATAARSSLASVMPATDWSKVGAVGAGVWVPTGGSVAGGPGVCATPFTGVPAGLGAGVAVGRGVGDAVGAADGDGDGDGDGETDSVGATDGGGVCVGFGVGL